MNLPEFVEYWIALSDSAKFSGGIVFLALLDIFLRTIRSRKRKNQIRSGAETYLLRRNGNEK